MPIKTPTDDESYGLGVKILAEHGATVQTFYGNIFHFYPAEFNPVVRSIVNYNSDHDTWLMDAAMLNKSARLSIDWWNSSPHEHPVISAVYTFGGMLEDLGFERYLTTQTIILMDRAAPWIEQEYDDIRDVMKRCARIAALPFNGEQKLKLAGHDFDLDELERSILSGAPSGLVFELHNPEPVA